ncbi:MAG: DUF1731 domain-containing protein, partial [Planctomycetales bacterium]|nr:DUF1731 domain-containing protein [Planctomycetales bacterium]
GVRVVHPRIGVILSRKGGALTKMLTPFKLGLGGRIGDGRQYWSWITLDELVHVISYLIESSQLHGAVNAVAPGTLTNVEFTKTLGQVLHRPTIFPMPAFAARLLMGEMAEALLLTSSRVQPVALEGDGYSFLHPELGPALKAILRA